MTCQQCDRWDHTSFEADLCRSRDEKGSSVALTLTSSPQILEPRGIKYLAFSGHSPRVYYESARLTEAVMAPPTRSRPAHRRPPTVSLGTLVVTRPASAASSGALETGHSPTARSWLPLTPSSAAAPKCCDRGGLGLFRGFYQGEIRFNYEEKQRLESRA